MERMLIPTLIDNILDKVEHSFAENHEIANEVLLLLYDIFDKVLNGALELVETNRVTVLHINDNCKTTNQFIFQVSGSSGATYVLFNRVNYCQCKFYQQKVLCSRTHVACKHFVAANLAFAWNKYRKFSIELDVYTDIVRNILKPEQSII